jgi:SAM-dependent methyltransferase
MWAKDRLLDENNYSPSGRQGKIRGGSLESWGIMNRMNIKTDQNRDRQIATDAARFNRFAPYYDGDYRDYDNDVEAIVGLAQEYGGPVLELGCGTGRVLLPVMMAGFQVTGVDISDGLLAVAQEKLARSSRPEGATLVEADLRDFDLSRRDFGFAFCTSNTLMHLTTPSDQLSVLNNAHRHLRQGGLLFLDLFNPDMSRLLEVNGLVELADEWDDTGTGAHVLKWSVCTIDLAEQLRDTLFIYEEVWPDGRSKRTLCPFVLRYLWRSEAELMLRLAGFQVIAVWGEFDGSPYNSNSEQLIFLAKKT